MKVENISPGSIRLANMKKNKLVYLFILPTLLYLLIFQFYPLLESIRLSFTDLSFLRPGSGKFVGLANFKDLLFNDPNFWRIVKNSFGWVLGSTIFQYFIAIPAAMVLNGRLVARPLWRGLLMIPWVTPTVIMGVIFKAIFDGDYGLVNYYLNTNIVWLGNASTVWPTLLLTSVWKGFPYATLMMLAGLQGIPKDIYEAAFVDGCSKLKQFFKITIPLLMPVLLTSSLVSIVISWTKFELIWVLTAGGPGTTTSILPTYVYTKAFINFDMGSGSAVAVISMLFMMVFILFYLKLFNRNND
ncbi:MAG: sugar ABC transporter permease [Clostridiaceae bacterium]